MVNIKGIKGLYASSKMHLLPSLLLSWLLGLYGGLQAAQPDDYTVEEDPMVQSIWQGQIDPALGWSTSPFLHSATPNHLWPMPTTPFNLSPSSFMVSDTLLMPNSLGNDLNMETDSSFMVTPNPVESPFYSFFEPFLTPNTIFPMQGEVACLSPVSSIPPSLDNSPPTLPMPIPSSKDKPSTITSTQPAIDKRSPSCGKSKPKKCTVGVDTRTIDRDKKPHACSYCNKSFIYKGNLTNHIRVHTQEKPYECSYCDKKFAQKSNLTTHLRIHANEKPFQCTYCAKSFTAKSNLTIHLRIHTNEKPYKCTYCHKRFTHQGNLIMHVRTHTQEKPYECTYCYKRFTQKGALKKHLRIHTKEKPYECAYCHKKFTQKTHLKVHIRTHTDDKPYNCNYCPKAFTQRSNLKKHLRKHTQKKQSSSAGVNTKMK